MKKKGFTLIELLAVIVIIAVIAAIVFPMVTRYIRKSQQDALKIQIEEIIRAAKDWALDNPDKLDSYHVNPTYVSIADLQTAAKADGETYLSNGKVKNPQTGEAMKGTVIITYNPDYSQYEYEYQEVDKAEFEKTKVTSAASTILQHSTPVMLSTSEGLYDDATQEKYIYRGKTPKNYINIDGSLWRILSIDKKTYQMRAIKTSHTTKNSWAGTTTPSSYRYGVGLSIYNYLNNQFYTNTSKLKQIVATENWHNGEVLNQAQTLTLAKSRAAQSTVKANIGLLSLEEYLDAAIDSTNACDDNFQSAACKNSNYLAFTSGYWLINTAGSNLIWTASTNGLTATAATSTDMIAMPVITIKASASLEDIKNATDLGSSSNPFVLKLS